MMIKKAEVHQTIRKTITKTTTKKITRTHHKVMESLEDFSKSESSVLFEVRYFFCIEIKIEFD